MSVSGMGIAVWGRRLKGSYLEGGHGRIPVIPVYGVELVGVVEFMVEL